MNPHRQTAAESFVQTHGKVRSVNDGYCEIDTDGQMVTAAMATHIPGLQAGQRVVIVLVDGDWLVTAAFPLPGQPQHPVSFDPATGTLRIAAPRLDLAAVAAVELRCGEALVRLTVDGRVQIEGVDIVSAAIASNRIEGASIDLN